MKVVLLLATHSQDALDAAVRQATAANTDDPAAIAMLLESPDPLPPPLNLRDHPRFAELEAVDVDLSQYAIADLAETA
jgi:hypothetical protein